MGLLFNLWLKIQKSTKLGKYGPKVAAAGVLVVQVGLIMQGKVDELDIDSSLLALGLLFTRSNLTTSQDVKARPDVF